MSAPTVPRRAPSGVAPALDRFGVVVLCGVLVATLVGLVAGTVGPVALVALVALVGVGAVVAHPTASVVVLLGLTPLLVGIDRGVLVPLMRPNEALLGLVVAGMALRGVWHLVIDRAQLRVTPVHLGILAMAVTSSLTPLLWMAGRGRPIESDDLLYASALWKYLAVFLVVRAGIRTERAVGAALGALLASGLVVAAVAVLQSMGLFGVPALLGRWFAPGDVEGLFEGRGSSTLSSSIAVGDVMAILLAVVLALAARRPDLRRPLAALGAVFAVGAIGSGQFSGVIALVLAALVASWASGRLGRAVLFGLPAAVVAGAAMWPVVAQRLAGFSSGYGVPQSWMVRYENLRHFFWPTLAADFNWTLGVRPSARVPAPEPWRDWVYIESGYTWLLWNGGVLFLVAFVAFVVVAVRALLPLLTATGPTGVAATASLAWIVVLVALMSFDPHLTMRGTADLGFVLLALALTRVGRGDVVPRRPHPARAQQRQEVT